jgi:hypothetical protein
MTTIALIGCSKTKKVVDRLEWVPARELYTGDLFRKRVAYVESKGLPWYILSAKSGVLHPDTAVMSYDATMGDKTEYEIAEWHSSVVTMLLDKLYYNHNEPPLKTVTLEIHAGAKYVQPLEQMLKLLGIKVVLPVKGLGIGEQLAYYGKAKGRNDGGHD